MTSTETTDTAEQTGPDPMADLDTAVGDLETAIDAALSLPPTPEQQAPYNAYSVRLSTAATRLAAASGQAYDAEVPGGVEASPEQQAEAQEGTEGDEPKHASHASKKS